MVVDRLPQQKRYVCRRQNWGTFMSRPANWVINALLRTQYTTVKAPTEVGAFTVSM